MLLDELEKAHTDVLGLLLQIMEEGCLTDSTGRRVSFRNAIVIMTSNVGGTLQGDGLGFCAGGREDQMGQAVRQAFTPEFLGRLDGTAAFSPLQPETMECIAGKYLRELSGRCSAQGTQLTFPPALPCFLTGPCTAKDGARGLRRLVQSRVEGPLSAFLLRQSRKPARVQAQLQGDQILFTA